MAIDPPLSVPLTKPLNKRGVLGKVREQLLPIPYAKILKLETRGHGTAYEGIASRID